MLIFFFKQSYILLKDVALENVSKVIVSPVFLAQES